MKEGELSVVKNAVDLFVKSAVRSMKDLDSWISNNGWAGYDPYDVKGTRIFVWALGLKRTSLFEKLFRKLIVGPLVLGEANFPKLTRVAFGVRPAINAKGMALFAKAYLNLYRSTRDEEYFKKATFCLEWLLKNTSPGHGAPCWGYPFDWITYVTIPAGTPASVVTAAACDAFWTAWRVTGEKKYLDTCSGICQFFIDKLTVDQIDGETICFSYTPLDEFHVHNANLLVAELLIRVGSQIGRNDWAEMGSKAANYALREQNPDGSLFYWGAVQNHLNPNRVDHYHAGFEMRCLYGIWKSTGMEKYKIALDRYYEFYIQNLLHSENGSIIPKMYPNDVFPINIHSCAEGLILNATLGAVYERAKGIMLGMIPWVINEMQEKDGHFIYMKRRFFGIEFRSNIAYVRWGQAWMLLALSEILLATNNEGHGLNG